MYEWEQPQPHLPTMHTPNGLMREVCRPEPRPSKKRDKERWPVRTSRDIVRECERSVGSEATLRVVERLRAL